VSTTEVLIGRKSNGFGLETKNTAIEIRHVAPSIGKTLALTSPKSCGRSVGIVRLWTQATEFSFWSLKYRGVNKFISAHAINEQSGDIFKAKKLCTVIARAELRSLNEIIRMINQVQDFKIVVESYLM
jgi:hypothetical protein